MMNKALFRLLGGLLLVGVLAACGENGSSGVTGEQRAAPATAPQPLAATVESPAAPAPEAELAAEAAAAEQVAARNGEQKAQPCLSCHSIENFAGFDIAELEAAMQSMRTGEMAHLPLPDSVSDADVAAIASFLAAAAAADG